MLPSALIYINGNIDGYGYSFGDLDAVGKEILEQQLHIDETITGDEFNSRFEIDPNYVNIIHNMGYRILVIKPDVLEVTNREYADALLTVKWGLAYVYNENLSLGLALPINKINIYEILRYARSLYVKII